MKSSSSKLGQNQSTIKDQTKSNGSKFDCSNNLIDKSQFMNDNQLDNQLNNPLNKQLDNLNEFPTNFNHQDKLIFNDTSKLLFTNDLGPNLTNLSNLTVINNNLTDASIVPVARSDTIDLNLDGNLNGLTNLSQNLNTDLGSNMVDNLSNNLNMNLINLPMNANLEPNHLPNQLLQTYELPGTQ